MTEHDHFTIAEEYSELKNVLDQKAQQNDKSKWICRTLLAAVQAEKKGQQQSFDQIMEDQEKQERINKKFYEIVVLLSQIESDKLRQEFDMKMLGQLEAAFIEAVYECRAARGLDVTNSTRLENWKI
jgi:hypothetical protein